MRRVVVELANIMAPADIGDLLIQESALRAHAAELDGNAGRVLRAQVDLALSCLHDFLEGTCPQIPLSAISAIAAGIAYLGSPLDLVPDFLPRLGTVDDAMVMSLACEIGADGLRRYCTAKGISAEPALPAPAPARTGRR